MKWSRSEFLNLVELRSQCWCYADLSSSAGFSVRHNNSVMFYAVLEGEITLSGIKGGPLQLQVGDVVMVLSGEAHTLRTAAHAPAEVLDFLNKDAYVDTPPNFVLGTAPQTTRLLCARLKVRWPSGQRPRGLPSNLRLDQADCPVNLQILQQSSHASGAAALLTKTAQMLFIAAFLVHPECKSLHRISNENDPILRARQYIELHPFNQWTIAILAAKVSMGRSSFAARFVAEIGQTPMGFITAERMQHALRLLAQSDMKLAAISEHVGYRSEAAFSRRFSEFFGTSPGKMRKQFQHKAQSEHRNTPRVNSAQAFTANLCSDQPHSQLKSR